MKIETTILKNTANIDDFSIEVCGSLLPIFFVLAFVLVSFLEILLFLLFYKSELFPSEFFSFVLLYSMIYFEKCVVSNDTVSLV